MNPWYGVLLIIVSYLIGNLDFAYILVKKKKNVDIRDYGSGNAGMTNVLRTQGGAMAFWVFVGDAAKGAFCVWAARALGFSEWWVAGAGMAVIRAIFGIESSIGTLVSTSISIMCANTSQRRTIAGLPG